ncbi:unnamed protein product [Moneuplotes crassus]|uniref:JmjC domain-containing protein n=1 Tax=Euplotes crassus TaxID=5936 RepID=A0AAD1XCS7_EUPCR|nr:unnamed protein product [Moneuplotes crassus]
MENFNSTLTPIFNQIQEKPKPAWANQKKIDYSQGYNAQKKRILKQLSKNRGNIDHSQIDFTVGMQTLATTKSFESKNISCATQGGTYEKSGLSEVQAQRNSFPKLSQKRRFKSKGKKGDCDFYPIGDIDDTFTNLIEEEINENKSAQDKTTKFINIKPLYAHEVYHNDKERFDNEPFLRYFERIARGADLEELGAIKIRAKDAFDFDCKFRKDLNLKFKTRTQSPYAMSKGEPIEENQEGYTFKEFFKKCVKNSKEIHKYFKHLPKNDMCKQIENNYWYFHKLDRQRLVKVEYANDIPIDHFGSGFPTEKENKYSSHPWNLNCMNSAPNTLLQFCPDKNISGINKPWMYISHPYSSFCWHYEDMMMYSINYMHEGTAKIWYTIPNCDRIKFEKYIKKKYKNLYEKDDDLFFNINFQVSPLELINNGIQVHRTIQRPGDYIITFPGCYHCGISLGYTLAEAVNFTSSDWLKYGFESIDIYTQNGCKNPLFPFEWMITQNIINHNRLSLSKSCRKEIFTYWQKFYSKEKRNRRVFLKKLKNKRKVKKECTEKLPDGDKTPEDAYECNYCINFCYFSMIKCRKCNIHYCTSHDFFYCEHYEDITLVNRFTDQELEEINKRAKEMPNAENQNEDEEDEKGEEDEEVENNQSDNTQDTISTSPQNSQTLPKPPYKLTKILKTPSTTGPITDTPAFPDPSPTPQTPRTPSFLFSSPTHLSFNPFHPQNPPPQDPSSEFPSPPSFHPFSTTSPARPSPPAHTSFQFEEQNQKESYSTTTFMNNRLGNYNQLVGQYAQSGGFGNKGSEVIDIINLSYQIPS